ncbi:unnamed protein product [Orchesella dallaii]|uniref:Uncharacterized protein n=1 Tax=Orchesella dallaii TaxID=48710 RepID=A0ABP1R7J8_9HEXA
MILNPCCCISSRTGATIIAVLEIIGDILIIYLTLAGVAHIESIEDPDLKDNKKRKITQKFKTYLGFENEDAEKIFSLIIQFVIYLLVACIINLVLSLFLINGIRKDRPLLILTYLIVNGIHLALGIVAMIFSETVFLMAFNAGGVLGIILSIYFLVVVYVAYVETRNNLLQGQNQAEGCDSEV